MSLGPEPPLLQLPAVDDITDQIEILGLDMMQEIHQTVCLATGRTKM
jgi:hypothetical protein